MKITKAMLHRDCRVTWLDPRSGKARTGFGADAQEMTTHLPKGRAGMARWRERGYFDDVTDGVARLIHSESWGERNGSKTEEEAIFSLLYEDAIVKVEFYGPVTEET